MVSLMPEIPLPSTSTEQTIIHERKRKYSREELATFKFDPALFTVTETRIVTRTTKIIGVRALFQTRQKVYAC